MRMQSVPWRRVWRGTGASASADGSYDVRSFPSGNPRAPCQAPSGRFVSERAIGACTLRRDVAGNPAIHKAKAISRIDLCSAQP